MNAFGYYAYLLFALGFLPFRPVHAQVVDTGAQIGTQQDVVRRDDEEVVEQELQLRLSDPELGEIDLVSRAPKPKMFSFSTDQNFLYTSNAFLAPMGEQDSVFWNGRLNASIVPYATRNFTPRVTFEQNFFRYDRFSRLDFDSQSLGFDMKFDFRRDDSCFANLSYTGARLYAPEDDFEEFYSFGLLNASFTHRRQLGQWPLQFEGSAGTAWRHGDPSDFDRATVYLNFGLLYQPFETVQFAAFVRPDLQFYLDDPNSSSRTDINVGTGVSATWTPIEYLSFGATVSFTGNSSSLDQEDYDVFLPSIVIAGRISF